MLLPTSLTAFPTGGRQRCGYMLGPGRGVKIGPPWQDIHLFRGAEGPLVNRRHPSGQGVAADDRAKNTRVVEVVECAGQPLEKSPDAIHNRRLSVTVGHLSGLDIPLLRNTRGSSKILIRGIRGVNPLEPIPISKRAAGLSPRGLPRSRFWDRLLDRHWPLFVGNRSSDNLCRTVERAARRLR